MLIGMGLVLSGVKIVATERSTSPTPIQLHKHHIPKALPGWSPNQKFLQIKISSIYEVAPVDVHT
jgi:hypothetical protein